jgi:outer membrane protein
VINARQVAAALAFAALPQSVTAQDTLTPTPVSLGDAVRMAELRSPELRIARAGVARAEGFERQARSQFLPQLFGSASYTRTLRSQFSGLGGGDGGSEPDTAESPFGDLSRVGFGAKNQYNLGLSLSQNLFAGGRIRAQTAAARASKQAAEIALRSQRAQLTLDVAEAYFDASLADRLATIAELSLRQSEGTVSQAQLALDVGSTSEFELLRARVARDNQRPIVIQRRTERDIALLRLRQLLGLPLDTPLTLSTPVDDTASSLALTHYASVSGSASSVVRADTSTNQRAPVRQASAVLNAQRSQLRASRAQRIPQLAITSQYGRLAFPLSGLPANDEFVENWTVGVGLQVPLFTGGRISGEVQSARAAVEEARGQLDLARQLAELDARVQLSAMDQAEATWLASTGTAEQATRAYAIAEVRYREGISTQLELDDSRLLLEQAQVNRAVAARNLQIARLRLALLPDLPLQLNLRGRGNAPGQTAPSAPPSERQQPAPQQQQATSSGSAFPTATRLGIDP